MTHNQAPSIGSMQISFFQNEFGSHQGDFNMKQLAYIVGAVLVFLDLMGIVVGFQSSVGTGLAALFIPPYAIYLGATGVW